MSLSNTKYKSKENLLYQAFFIKKRLLHTQAMMAEEILGLFMKNFVILKLEKEDVSAF